MRPASSGSLYEDPRQGWLIRASLGSDRPYRPRVRSWLRTGLVRISTHSASLEPLDDPELAEERAILELDDQGRNEEAASAYRAFAATAFDDVRAQETDEGLMSAFDAMTAADDGTHDEDLGYMDPEMRIRFARDVRESLTTYDGISHDNIAVGRRWDFDATAIRQPSFLWYGEFDSALMGHAHWWQEQIPHAHLTLREGSGHGSSYLLHWADMFRSLTT